jgi:formylglycine-generating enzyme required for sulfatase activity
MTKDKFIFLTLVMLVFFSCDAFCSTPGIEMVEVKGGCFQMGETFGERPDVAEKPEHGVCVSDFAIGKFEVTQSQWEAVMGSNPSTFKEPGSNYPVENVSWEEVQVFIKKLNQKTGKKYRLPTEAEWEYAARSGGKKEKFAGICDGKQVSEYAWLNKNSGDKTHVVGTRKPNGLGIYDMTGNVSEWLGDWYGEDYYSKSPLDNPTGPRSGQNRTIRGGSWSYPAGWMRVWNRDYGAPNQRNSNVGFRLVEQNY